MRLSALQTAKGGYSLVDFSQAYGLAEMFNLDIADPDQAQNLSWIMEYTTSVLANNAHGLILGPEIGYGAILQKSPHTGIALTMEKQSHLLAVDELPRLYDRWGVEHIRNNYGVVYFKFYYHPDEPLADQKLQMASEIFDSANYEGVDLIIELSLHPSANKSSSKDFAQTQVFAATQFQQVCDLLVLEYPHTPLGCASLSAQLDIPWILADRTADYALYKDQLRVALENGANGAQLDGVIWSGLGELDLNINQQKSAETWAKVEKYIQTELKDRVIEVNRIIDENQPN